ncbi:hypothetical protein NLI96_g6577 [Meripilus lineatus]|uniref:Uncharacterized protein n=1 Tax=Meripilus lineatus TaxID=2056292 RepID=A0AAD5YHY5_9APHY|nr:hypothetical protein NLI96_g6577 [Physisporinus lineatus]
MFAVGTPTSTQFTRGPAARAPAATESPQGMRRGRAGLARWDWSGRRPFPWARGMPSILRTHPPPLRWRGRLLPNIGESAATSVPYLPNPLCRTAVAQPSLPTGEEWRDSSLESSHPPTSVAVAGFTGSWPPGFLARSVIETQVLKTPTRSRAKRSLYSSRWGFGGNMLQIPEDSSPQDANGITSQTLAISIKIGVWRLCSLQVPEDRNTKDKDFKCKIYVQDQTSSRELSTVITVTGCKTAKFDGKITSLLSHLVNNKSRNLVNVKCNTGNTALTYPLRVPFPSSFMMLTIVFKLAMDQASYTSTELPQLKRSGSTTKFFVSHHLRTYANGLSRTPQDAESSPVSRASLAAPTPFSSSSRLMFLASNYRRIC